jgi:hypothetical protein
MSFIHNSAGMGAGLVQSLQNTAQELSAQLPKPTEQQVNQASVQSLHNAGQQQHLHGLRQEFLQLRAHVRGIEQELAARGHEMPPQMREAIKRDLDAAHRKLDSLVDRLLQEMPQLKEALNANAQAMVSNQVKLAQATLMQGQGGDVGQIRDNLQALAKERAQLMEQIAPQTSKQQDAVLDARHDLRRVMADLQRTPPGPQRDHLMKVRDDASQRLDRAMGELQASLPPEVQSKYADLRAENRELHHQAMGLMDQLHKVPPLPPEVRARLDQQLQAIFADQRDNAYQMDKLLGF